MANPTYNELPVKSRKTKNTDDVLINEADAFCPCTDAVRSIPAEESTQIQDGLLYKAEIKLALPGVDAAPANVKFLVFKTPPASAGDPVYVLWGTDIIRGDVNNIDYQLFEEAVWTDDPGDTPQPAINNNRVLAATVPALSELFNATVNPVTVDPAKEIDLDAILGGQVTGPQTAPVGSAGGSLRFTGPLKPDTKHAIRLTNNDANLVANIVVKSAFIEARLPGLYAQVNL